MESVSVVRKRIYGMILPIILENILQLGANLVSAAMLGRIGAAAVSAQGVSALLTNIIWNFLKGVTIGATVLIAQAFGAKDEERMKVVAMQTIGSLVLCAFVAMGVVFIFADKLLLVFGAEHHIVVEATKYLRTVCFGFPFLAISLCVTGILQGKGDARTPMVIAGIMNCVNILVGGTMIFGWLGNPPLGLQGAAVGLVAAEFTAAMCGVYALFNKRSGMLHGTLRMSYLRFQSKVLKEIYRIGIPSGLETIMWSLASILLSRVMLSFGEIAYAANQLGLQAESLSEMPALGFGVAATAFTGQAVGAVDGKLGRRYIKEIEKGSMIIMTFGTCLLVFFPHFCMKLLTDDPEIIALGAVYLRLMGFIQIPQNLQRVFAGALKGAGHTKIPMFIAMAGLWGIRVPLAFLMTYGFHLGIQAMWAVVCVDQVVRFILSYVLYRKYKVFDKLDQQQEALQPPAPTA